MSPNGFSKDFPIDVGIFTTAKVSLVDASTDADVKDAILAGTTDKFPDRDIQLGHIAVAADTGKVSLQPAAAGGATVSFDISASAQSGIGVYTKSADAIKALNLADAPKLDIKDVDGQRYVLMDWGYSVAGSGSVSHPIGVLGSVSFGVDAKRDALFAILHRFGKDDRAHIALDDTFASWRLPRHVKFDNGDVNLKPATWLIAEADGSLALTVAASLGWNVNFAKDATLLGVTQDLSVKIDASLKATFGFNVAGKYLVVVARESDKPVVRLQLWKQSSKGFSFGFNVSVGVQGADPQLPTNLDDFIKTTLGVHGLQVVNDVRDWAENTTDLGQRIAGLANQAALDLLTQATGIDAGKEFDKAKQTVLDALKTWDDLPEKLPPMLWKLLPPAASADLATLQTFLGKLKDPTAGADELAKALQKATFGDSPEGQFLEAVADKGLLALADQFGVVSTRAGQVLDLLNGGVIAKLQAIINQKLNLDQIRKAVTDSDFANIDQWLQNRLGNFLDRTLKLDDLKDFQNAIKTLDSKAAGYYKTGVQALTKKYSVEFAATYQSTTTDTALVDVDFDLSNAEASALFADVATTSTLNALLTKPTNGVTLHQATLTHEIKRQSTVDLNLPLFNFHGSSVNDAMVTLTSEDQGGRVLLYQVSGKDVETAANRASSQLAVLASLDVVGGQPQLDSGATISYEMRQVKADMRPVDLESRTTAFIHDYLSGLFSGGDASIRSFYADIDNGLSAAIGNQTNHLGDMAVSMQLSLSAAVLGGWFVRRDPNRLKADQMQLSRRLQLAFQDHLPALYFQDLDQYALNESVAALLVWSSLPVSTSVDFDGTSLKFNTDRDVFWNWPDVDTRRAIARDSHTFARLAGRLAGIQTQLREAGHSNADDFDPSKANRFVEQALNAVGDEFFRSLLISENALVTGAADALAAVSIALGSAQSASGTTIAALAKFAGALTKTFNDEVQTIYSGVSGRTIGPMLLVESSAALGSLGATPHAMLTLLNLKPGHAFDLGSYVDGKNPPQSDVALVQTLVSLK
jgi:hypothetical protein